MPTTNNQYYLFHQLFYISSVQLYDMQPVVRDFHYIYSVNTLSFELRTLKSFKLQGKILVKFTHGV